MKINMKYISAFLILLVIETIIALYIHDRIIRPYVGDVLVIFLMYSFIRGVYGNRNRLLPLYLFIFSVLVEMAQYFQLVKLLKLQDNRILSIIIGSQFDIKDILCYLFASLILVFWNKSEYNINKRRKE